MDLQPRRTIKTQTNDETRPFQMAMQAMKK